MLFFSYIKKHRWQIPSCSAALSGETWCSPALAWMATRKYYPLVVCARWITLVHNLSAANYNLLWILLWAKSGKKDEADHSCKTQELRAVSVIVIDSTITGLSSSGRCADFMVWVMVRSCHRIHHTFIKSSQYITVFSIYIIKQKWLNKLAVTLSSRWKKLNVWKWILANMIRVGFYLMSMCEESWN